MISNNPSIFSPFMIMSSQANQRQPRSNRNRATDITTSRPFNISYSNIRGLRTNFSYRTILLTFWPFAKHGLMNQYREMNLIHQVFLDSLLNMIILIGTCMDLVSMLKMDNHVLVILPLKNPIHLICAFE